MKRAIITVVCMLLVFVAVISVSGCFGEPEDIPDIELSDILGTWRFDKDNGSYIEYSFSDAMKYTKKESASGGSPVFSTGTFSLEGNIITITPFETMSKPTKHEISVYNGDSMIWGRGSVTSEYIKQ